MISLDLVAEEARDEDDGHVGGLRTRVTHTHHSGEVAKGMPKRQKREVWFFAIFRQF